MKYQVPFAIRITAILTGVALASIQVTAEANGYRRSPGAKELPAASHDWKWWMSMHQIKDPCGGKLEQRAIGGPAPKG